MGTSLQPRRPRITSRPLDAGQAEVEDDHVGWVPGGELERLLAGGGEVDVVAAGPQVGGRAPAGSAARRRRRGPGCVMRAASARLIDHGGAAAGGVVDLDGRRPWRRRSPGRRPGRGRRRCRRGCRRGAGTAGTPAPRSTAGCPGPGRSTRRSTRPPNAPASTRTRRPGGREADGVVDDVGQRPFEQRGVGQHRRQRLGELARRRSARAGPRLARAAGTTSSRPTGAGASAAGRRPGGGSCRAGCSTSVVSRSVSSSMVARNSARLLGRPVDVGLAEAGDRRLDRRQRRAQVVGDRLEQRAAQLVGLGQRVGPAGLGPEPAVLEDGGELGGEGVEHERGPRRRCRGPPSASTTSGRSSSTRSASSGRGGRASPAAASTRQPPSVAAEHGGRVEAEDGPQVARAAPAAGRPRPSWRPGGPGSAASARARAASARAAGGGVDEAAHDDGDAEEDDEGDDVLGLGDGPPVEGRGEEPVGGQERADGGERARAACRRPRRWSRPGRGTAAARSAGRSSRGAGPAPGSAAARPPTASTQPTACRRGGSGELMRRRRRRRRASPVAGRRPRSCEMTWTSIGPDSRTTRLIDRAPRSARPTGTGWLAPSTSWVAFSARAKSTSAAATSLPATSWYSPPISSSSWRCSSSSPLGGPARPSSLRDVDAEQLAVGPLGDAGRPPDERLGAGRAGDGDDDPFAGLPRLGDAVALAVVLEADVDLVGHPQQGQLAQRGRGCRAGSSWPGRRRSSRARRCCRGPCAGAAPRASCRPARPGRRPGRPRRGWSRAGGCR